MKIKEEILLKHGRLISGPTLMAMDEYMEQTCLELLEYMANNEINCTSYENEQGQIVHSFHWNGKCITKEQLFKNFL